MDTESNTRAVPCALLHCRDYGANLSETVGKALASAELPCKSGMRVLVKPNLLTAKELACSNPALVAAACKWLLDMGCKVEVADSPAFGRASAVAHSIGLDRELAPLGIGVQPMDRPRPMKIEAGPDYPKPVFMVSERALECDYILSIPKIKAHSQMRITLAVKNCYGCVCGLRKALIHAREGRDPACFAASIAALWAALPPMGALADGILAMSGTGPSKGNPCPLGLVGASRDALVLDRAILETLGIDRDQSPLHKALAQRPDCPGNTVPIVYPHEKPANFDISGFTVPKTLEHTSFRPARLAKSLWRRFWLNLLPAKP